MVPYLASLDWYRTWLSLLLQGVEPTEGVSRASAQLGLRGKEIARGRIIFPTGSELLLSVPVVGGASVLKNPSAREIIVSEHGNWPRNHLGSLETAYGRTPFYHHLAPEIDSILSQAPGRELAQVTGDIHALICRVTGLPEVLPSLRQGLKDEPARFAAVSHNLMIGGIDPNEAFLGRVAHWGPDALFSLLCNI